MARVEERTDVEAGFTLLETIVAFAILSVVLAATMQSISLSINNLAKAHQARHVDRLVDIVLLEAFVSYGDRGERPGLEEDLSWKLETEILGLNAAGRTIIRFRILIQDRRTGRSLRDIATYKVGQRQ